MKFLDICSGIGGFRSGLEQAGHKCIGYVEIDKYARKSYEAMYQTEGEWTEYDITKVRADNIPRADIWCFGFPCQDISVAGKREGLSGSRSGIFYDIIELLKSKSTEDKPEWLLIENVKNLLSIDEGQGFTEVLTALDKTGYDAEWALLNSKNFGVPQNRERIFIIGHLRERGTRKVLFETGTDRQADREIEQKINMLLPNYRQNERIYGVDGVSRVLTSSDGGGIGNGVRTGLYAIPTEVKQIIPGNQAHRVYDSEGLSVTVKAEGGGVGAKSGLYAVPKENTLINGVHSQDIILHENSISRCLMSRDYKGAQNVAVAPTSDSYGVFVYEGKEYNIRRLTPRECFRLQGFTDEQFDKAQKVNSDTQLYKQAGNAVTVNVARYIGELLNKTQ